jgi:hypothetical protein
MTIPARVVPLRVTGAVGTLIDLRHLPLSSGRRQWAA